MAILNELRALIYMIFKALGEFLEEYGLNITRYLRTIIITLLIISVGTLGYFGYSWYIVSREHTAHQAMAEYMRDYQLARQVNTPQAWERLDGLLAIGYTNHKNSNVAPFFLMLRADALLHRDNRVEAIHLIDQAIAALPSSSPIVPLFTTKRALMLLDSSDEAVQQEGLQNLITVARDKNNPYNDLALFYLGRYYWAHDNVQEAKKTWRELVEVSSREQAYPSPWVAEAKNALKHIVD